MNGSSANGDRGCGAGGASDAGGGISVEALDNIDGIGRKSKAVHDKKEACVVNGVKSGFEVNGEHVQVFMVKFGILKDRCKELELASCVAALAKTLLGVVE